MSRYPTLKIGDTIKCKTYREAFSLGVDISNEGFSYQIRGNNIIFITERNYFDNAEKPKGNRETDKRERVHA